MSLKRSPGAGATAGAGAAFKDVRTEEISVAGAEASDEEEADASGGGDGTCVGMGVCLCCARGAKVKIVYNAFLKALKAAFPVGPLRSSTLAAGFVVGQLTRRPTFPARPLDL